ncbi:MAG: gamma-glutamylcyclotransferase family protein [Terracidiphilus sp.]|jgi:gamma-glutamylcyclotransferase (GGCT)/AIG2-like uncharacterized protein YtfP
MGSYLFTYGTLRPGHAPDEIAPAVEKLRLAGRGFVHGILYDLGDYPGAVLDPSCKQKIFGTVFRLPEDETILRRLDEYEGFDPSAPDSSLFIRTLQTVVLSKERTRECWTYVYNGKLESARILATGRYRKKRLGTATEKGSPG